MFQNPFNYETKSEIDFHLIKVREFINNKINTQTKEDRKYIEAFSEEEKQRAEKFILELSLSEDESANDTEESKSFSVSNLTKASRVAILRAYMLAKQMNWLRTVMQDTFELGIQNWCLPLNHFIPVHSNGAPFWGNVEFANVYKGCRRLGGPFDTTALCQAIGGNVRIYKA